MRLKILFILSIFLIPLVSAAVQMEDIYVEDTVQGHSLEVIDFEDDLLLIDSLLYNEGVRNNFNRFNGFFYEGYDAGYSYYGGNAKFYGSMVFNDMSKVTYAIEDFVVEDTHVNEFGITEAWGNGMFTYTLTVKITKSIPVDVIYSFYNSWDDGYTDGYKEQNIYAAGDNFFFEAYGENNFRHNKVIT